MKKIILVLISTLILSCEVVNIDYLTPVMITDEPLSILANSAIMGGRVLGEGGLDVVEYGIVYSESFPPTINDSKIIEGERVGSFTKRYEVFDANTTYYYTTYGINEIGIGYGAVYEFTTDAEPLCNPTYNNILDIGDSVISINDVVYEEPSGFNDGNVQFQTRTSSSTLKVTLQFNEINGDLPLTGEYVTVVGFDNQSMQSNGEVMLNITDFGLGSLGGGVAESEQKIYVQNDGNNITFIYCGVTVTSNYTLDGKYTYSQ